MGIRCPGTSPSSWAMHCIHHCSKKARSGRRSREEDRLGGHESLRLPGLNPPDYVNHIPHSRNQSRWKHFPLVTSVCDHITINICCLLPCIYMDRISSRTSHHASGVTHALSSRWLDIIQLPWRHYHECRLVQHSSILPSRSIGECDEFWTPAHRSIDRFFVDWYCNRLSHHIYQTAENLARSRCYILHYWNGRPVIHAQRSGRLGVLALPGAAECRSGLHVPGNIHDSPGCLEAGRSSCGNLDLDPLEIDRISVGRSNQ